MTGNTVTDTRRIWRTDLTFVDGSFDPGYECTFGCDSGTGDKGFGPTVYVFANNDIPNVRNSGSREITTILRTSFDPVPQCLEDRTWGEHTSSDVQDGLYLDSYEE